ncbi:MAG: long-chain fatty acid--CoA ligase, partial [Spirochaetales bacterium]|nr:long-chain fatty acid--CoA ligase [Spirochaetales bacterium]
LGLDDLGVRAGDRVGLISPPGPEWIIVDGAIQSVGGITVPIFKKISPESFEHEVADSGMRYLFVGYPDEIPMAVEHGRGLAELVTFGCCTDNDRFDRLVETGRRIAAERPERFNELLGAVGPDDLCTIIYTSGSTGLPKGVELTHANLMSQIEAAGVRFELDPEVDVAMSLLPLAHIFERMVVYFYLTKGMRVYFADDPRNLTDYVGEVRPTAMTVVPRLLEKVYLTMKEKTRAKTGIVGTLAHRAFARAETRDENARPTLADRFYDRLVYRTFRSALGGRAHTLISGSAKLAPEVARFFINVGLPIYEGYGMTESSPVVAANYRGNRKVGTVGPLFPGVEVRIAEDGEVLVRGPNVMRGYYNRPDATAETVRDGWLYTGDLGSLDGDGYLTINGRKKELFKKSTGEYVPPVPIERAIAEHPAVDTAVIFADNRVYVTALLFPDVERLGRIKEERGLAAMSDAEYLQSRDLYEELEGHIAEVNRHRHHCEQIVRFTIMDHPASIETGELTPTMKIRRGVIEELYGEKIEGMYEHIGGNR